MKVLRDTDWTPVGYIEYFEPMSAPVFLFQHKKFGDVVALNVAKFVDVTANVVHYYDANRNLVSVSSQNSENTDSPSVPKLRAYGA